MSSINIDYRDLYAIIRELVKKLRASVPKEPELPSTLKVKFDRLREVEEQDTPPLAPGNQ